MTTFTAILSSTGTTETLSGNTLAMGAAAFRSLWGQTFRGEECPEEVHDVDPSGDSGIPAFLADDVLPRAVTVSSLAAGKTGYVLLQGQGVDGADVWALVTGVTEAAEAPAPPARAITVAIDSDCRLGSMPLIWGAVEGDDSDAAVANAREWIGEGGELSAAEVRRRAENLDVVTIQWAGKLPDGDNAAAIALALAGAGDF